jgi:hypothetical protein
VAVAAGVRVAVGVGLGGPSFSSWQAVARPTARVTTKNQTRAEATPRIIGQTKRRLPACRQAGGVL